MTIIHQTIVNTDTFNLHENVSNQSNKNMSIKIGDLLPNDFIIANELNLADNALTTINKTLKGNKLNVDTLNFTYLIKNIKNKTLEKRYKKIDYHLIEDENYTIDTKTYNIDLNILFNLKEMSLLNSSIHFNYVDDKDIVFFNKTLFNIINELKINNYKYLTLVALHLKNILTYLISKADTIKGKVNNNTLTYNANNDKILHYRVYEIFEIISLYTNADPDKILFKNLVLKRNKEKL